VAPTASLQAPGAVSSTQPAPSEPDIAFACSALAFSIHEPEPYTITAAVRVPEVPYNTLRNGCSGTPEGVQLELKGYSDSDWNNEPDGGLQQGHTFPWRGSCSWHTKSWKGLHASPTEAEYKALSTPAKEAIWSKQRCSRS